MKGDAYISLSDEDLMKRITSGDRRSFEVLYERYFERLIRFGNKFITNQAQVEDLIQETFLILIHDPEKFNPQYRFSTWIFTVLANKCKNAHQKETRRAALNQIIPSQDGPDTARVSENTDLIRRIRSFIADQSEKEQMLFHLRFEQDLSIEEIAGIMNIPQGSVKSGLFYLLKKVRKPFNQEFP